MRLLDMLTAYSEKLPFWFQDLVLKPCLCIVSIASMVKKIIAMGAYRLLYGVVLFWDSKIVFRDNQHFPNQGTKYTTNSQKIILFGYFT